MKTAELQKNLDIQMQNAENLQTKLKKLNDALNRNKKDPAMVLQLQKKDKSHKATNSINYW